MQVKKIIINKDFSEELYQKSKTLWETSLNAYINVELMSIDELSALCKRFINKVPDPFSCIVLAELVENENLPLDLVEEIFIKGDVSCKVAVCLRNNLNETLKNLCANATETIVKEHFVQKTGNM